MGGSERPVEGGAGARVGEALRLTEPAGVPGLKVRRDVGQWATPLVERGYLRRTLTERLAFMRPTGL